MYTQLIDVLIETADNTKKQRFDIPLQLHLDEFANNSKIPDFEKLLATIRSRNIGITIYIQNKKQLKRLFKDEITAEILGNCDSYVFLGTSSGETAEDLSKELGNVTISYETSSKNIEKNTVKSISKSKNKDSRALMTNTEIYELDNKKLIYALRGVGRFIDEKYDIKKHKRYEKLYDGSNEENRIDLDEYIEKYRKGVIYKFIDKKDRRKTKKVKIINLGEYKKEDFENEKTI